MWLERMKCKNGESMAEEEILIRLHAFRFMTLIKCDCIDFATHHGCERAALPEPLTLSSTETVSDTGSHPPSGSTQLWLRVPNSALPMQTSAGGYRKIHNLQNAKSKSFGMRHPGHSGGSPGFLFPRQYDSYKVER